MAKRSAAAKAAPSDIIDIGTTEPVSEDEQLVTQAGAAVTTFLANVRGFFLTAHTLETRALARLAEAKALKEPTTAEEDVAIQSFVKATSADNKELVEHWKITTTISGFHRRMTARRGVSTDAIEKANRIGNDLHASYVRKETARAAAEQDRIRRAAEAEEQARRDREQAALEEEAVRREESSPEISARERTFVDLFYATNQAKESAQRAGFKDPLKTAARLLTLPKIIQAIEAKRSAATIRQQAAAAARQPLVVDTPDVKPNISRAPGATDRVTHSAELLDEAALIEAVIAGRYGIPHTILRVDQAALNCQARDLKALINKWPGVRYKENRGVI